MPPIPTATHLRFKLYIKADDETAWKPLTTDLDDKAYSWDAESFANGTYRLSGGDRCTRQSGRDPATPPRSA